MLDKFTSLLKPPYNKSKIIRIALFVAALLWLVARCSQSGPVGLELSTRFNGTVLYINNIGSGPIKINGITVNDRADCVVGTPSPLPANIKVGEGILATSDCRIVRAVVDTDQGSGTYTFR